MQRARSFGRTIRNGFKRQQRTEETRRKAQHSAQRRERMVMLSRRRQEERLNRWHKAFPRWLPLPWSTAGRLAAAMVEWFSALFAIEDPARVGDRRRVTGKRLSFFEPLEQRQMLAANLFVNNDWNFVEDTGDAGLSAGDIVDNSNEGDSTQYTYGTDAFGVVTTGTITGSLPAFDSIQDAVNTASSGDIVNVLAGTYTESVTVAGAAGVRDNLTIQGAGAAATTLNGGFIVQTDTSNLGPSGLTIAGFDINGGTLSSGHKVGILVRAVDATITDNVIRNVTDSQATGIETVAGSNNLLIERNAIYDN